MSKTRFRKSAPKRTHAVPAPHSLPAPGRPWLIAAVALAGVAVAVAAVFIIKRRPSPRYWSDEDIGPAQINSRTPPGPAPEGMVWVPGGVFWMGSEEFADAKPVHRVYVDGFWMDATAVTNAQFARFVE